MNTHRKWTLVAVGAAVMSMAAYAQPWQNSNRGPGVGKPGYAFAMRGGFGYQVADSNQDGQVTKAEADKMGWRFQQRFVALDQDKDGKVATGDLAAGCPRRGS